MDFNTHFHLKDKHAFLSASSYHWTNYDDAKLVRKFETHAAAQLGTAKHELASMLIQMKQKLPKTNQTLPLYVNDAIGYRMTPEQVLYYSDNAFGTADAICFRNDLLRIHDLKTGTGPCSMRQLEIYTAFFHLEYNFTPGEFDVELRLYQNDKMEPHRPNPKYIAELMEKIITFDRRIDQLRLEELG
jgi:hypothetical protein